MRDEKITITPDSTSWIVSAYEAYNTYMDREKEAFNYTWDLADCKGSINLNTRCGSCNTCKTNNIKNGVI